MIPLTTEYRPTLIRPISHEEIMSKHLEQQATAFLAEHDFTPCGQPGNKIRRLALRIYALMEEGKLDAASGVMDSLPETFEATSPVIRAIGLLMNALDGDRKSLRLAGLQLNM